MKKLLLLSTFLLTVTILFSQSIDLNNINGRIKDLKSTIKNTPFKLSGGVSANSVFYKGNSGFGRSPFMYYFQGNVNLSIYGKFNLPFSFSYANGVKSVNQPQKPTLPKRLSIHPTYKGVTAHIGDASMGFSPYTLNGVMFTGLGLDLVFKKPLTVNIMYGRLQKGVNYDSTDKSKIPMYRRIGTGAKVKYEAGKVRLTVSSFYASDIVNSLLSKPDSVGIYPKQNIAMGYELGYKPMKGLDLVLEYSTSTLNRDIRNTAPSDSKTGSYYGLIKTNSTTQFFTALKSQLNYTFQKSTIGIGFERVDPGYTSLGTYYTNSDMQNITVNFGQSLFKSKVSIAGNVGYQRDNLDNKKLGSNNRIVGSFNLAYNPSAKLQTTANYSNFQTIMNIKSNFTNQEQLPFQNPDTLNYKQVSQNASVMLNYFLKQNASQIQMLNLNCNFTDVFDQQGGIVVNGNQSQLYNFMLSHNLGLPKKGVNFTTVLIGSYNTIGRNKIFTQGPSLSCNAMLFKKKVSASYSSSFIFLLNNGKTSNRSANNRLSLSYVLKKKHNFTLSAVHQFTQANANIKKNRSDLTATVSYSWRF